MHLKLIKEELYTAIIFGGVDGERFVSLASAKNLSKSFRFDKYIYVHKDKNIFIVEEDEIMKQPIDFISEFAFETYNNQALSIKEVIKELPKNTIFFIALHGKYGEDGDIQEELESMNIKFTGSSSIACRLAFNKKQSKTIASKKGLKVPLTINDKNNNSGRIITKPIKGGSSIDVNYYNNYAECPDEIKSNSNYLIEEVINGREFSCAVINKKIGLQEALVPIEILTDDIFGYEEKYISTKTKEIVLKGEEDLIKKIQKNSEIMHTALKCTGYSRSDFIYNGEDLFYLETNTLPGLTKSSIIIKELKEEGITLSEFIEGQINLNIQM